MKRTIVQDPDFGRIELSTPRMTPSQWLALRIRATAANRAKRPWRPGRIYACPRCGARRFRGRDDLQVEVPRGDKILVFLRVRGGRCDACDAQYLDGAGQMDLEDALEAAFHADYEAKVSRIGHGTVGTYWPKELARVLGLRPDRRLFVEVLGRDAALLRVRDPDSARRRRRRTPACRQR